MAFDPINDLERSLVKAATDPAHRPQFYRDFVGADIFVVQRGPAPVAEEHRALSKGETLELITCEHEGKTVLPIFSSLPRLQVFIKKEACYLAMKASDFLQVTQGTTLMLNPGSDYGKEFTAKEVASILDGSLWKPSERWVVQKKTTVHIGQPASYPSELVTALSRYFQKTRQVKRAYLAHYFNPERDEKAHTLIAIEVSGDWDQVAAGAGIVANGVLVPDPPVDFTPITGEAGFKDYFRQGIKPFYEKKKFLGLF